MKRAIIFVMVLFSLSLFIGARDFILKKGGVSIWFPDNWNVREMRDGSIVASTFDGDILCRLDLIATLYSYNNVLAYDFVDFRPVQPEPVTDPAGRNGLPFKYWQGPANRGGMRWNLSVDFYKVPNGTVMFVYGMLAGADAKYAGITGDLRRMCTSIRRVSSDGW